MNFNKYIFKFSVIDDNFMDNLKNNELLTKHFDDFNDPYDAHYGVDATWPDFDREKEKLTKIIKNIEPEKYKEILKSKDFIIQYINSNNHLIDYTFANVSERLSRFRVCSFTRRWNQILMWSHYADGCRGLALIFDQDKLPMDSKSRLFESGKSLDGTTIPIQWVKYKNIPPVLNAVEVFESVRIGTGEALNDIALKMLETCALTKYKKWSYEQESRLVTAYDDSIYKERVFYKYKSDALKGAIIGHKCDPDKIIKIAKLMPEDAIIYFADAVNNKYKLKINRSFPAKQIASGKVKLGRVVN